MDNTTKEGKGASTNRIRQPTIYDRWRHEEAIIAAAGGASTQAFARLATEKEKELVRKMVAAFEARG